MHLHFDCHVVLEVLMNDPFAKIVIPLAKNLVLIMNGLRMSIQQAGLTLIQNLHEENVPNL